MLESSLDTLTMSARILARFPPRVGASIFARLEDADQRSGGKPWILPGLTSRAAGHRAALHRLFSPASTVDPELSRRAAWRHLRWVCDCLAGFGGRHFSTTWQDETDLKQVADRGEALLIVTVHVGNWLATAEAVTARIGPIETVAGVQFRPRWDDSIRRHLADRGVVLHRPHLAYRRFRERLAEGGTVVLHLDGTPSPSDRGRERSARAPLGVRAATRLIATARPRVFGVVSRRTSPDTYTLFVEDLADANEDALLGYLRRQVSFDPSDWLIFRADHLGDEVR